MPGVLLFSGCYQPPLDEGVKLIVHYLRQEMERPGPVTVATTASGVPGDVAEEMAREVLRRFYRRV